MELITKIELNFSPSNIIELQDGNYALTLDKTTLILNKDTFKIIDQLDNHEKKINRVMETKNRKLITISEDKTMVVNELDENNHYKLIQRVNEPDKINSIIELSTGEILTCNCDENIRIYKYDKEKNNYQLNYSYNAKEIVTHAAEAKNGKIFLLTFEGDDNLLKLYSYSLEKKKIEKMLLTHGSICWNNNESMLNISDKFLAINLFNTIVILDKENISVFQEFSLIKDFIDRIGLFKSNNSIIFSTLMGKKYIWESNEDNIWELNEDIDLSILKGENKCYLQNSRGELLVGIGKGLKIFKIE